MAMSIFKGQHTHTYNMIRWRTVDGLVILLFAEGDLIYWVLVLVKLIVCLLLSLLPPLAGEVAVA